MRIHINKAEHFIGELVTAIGKDPASFEQWRCLHVGHSESASLAQREQIIRQLKETHQYIDCDIVYCADHDVLFISTSAYADALDNIANEFIVVASLIEGRTEAITHYDVFHDWQALRELLRSKIVLSLYAVDAPALHDFANDPVLQTVFVEAKQHRSNRTPLYVMVVEDDPLTRRMVTNAFKDHYVMIIAINAQEAITNYLLHAPDIVFLDIGLPDASGYDVLQQILVKDPEAYVVMFSANSDLDNVTTALARGASGFVAKPFKKEKMRHYIEDSALHHGKQPS
jgi:CheY-like chemotaxis protein